jgi:hypothetical protein
MPSANLTPAEYIRLRCILLAYITGDGGKWVSGRDYPRVCLYSAIPSQLEVMLALLAKSLEPEYTGLTCDVYKVCVCVCVCV